MMDASDAPLRILVVDDHEVVRVGIAAIIGETADMKVVADASDGVQAVEQFRKHAPDVTLMDLQMPGLSGIEATRAILEISPSAAIVVLTSFGGDVQSLRAIGAGASAFTTKDGLRQKLLETIRRVHEGQRQTLLTIHTEPTKTAPAPSQSGDRQAQCVAKAVAWLSEHFGEPMTGEDLARHVNMSAATFYEHFKALTGTTPLQYQKRLRLDSARRLILNDNVDIANAAYSVGYNSASHFAREYRRAFGASPQEDKMSGAYARPCPTPIVPE
jgi:YesN/AraC family two-component response regulator